MLNLEKEISFPQVFKKNTIPTKGVLAATGYELKFLTKNYKGVLLEKPSLLAGFSKLKVGDNCFLAGPFLGAPMAVMLLENLLRNGAKKFIFFGLAGSINNNLNVGDIFLPTKAISTEGTSPHYPAKLAPSSILLENLKKELKGNLKYTEGLVWSTDALYRETKGLIIEQQKKGALAVDMETAALTAAANFRKVDLAAVLLISDKVEIEKETWQAGFQEKRFKENLNNLSQIVWKTLENE